MKVDNVVTANNRSNSVNPSFGAVHPAKYYIKHNGVFEEVLPAKTIQSLQSKLIRWLNKDYYDAQRVLSGERPRVIKSESAQDKSLRERLVSFFTRRDEDYKQRNIVKSFYENIGDGRCRAYIFTGKSTDVIEDAAKPLGQVRGEISHHKKVLNIDKGIPYHNTDSFLPESIVIEEKHLSRNYFHKIKDFIKNIFSRSNSVTENALFEAYFVPRLTGKKIKYELVDAKFNGK